MENPLKKLYRAVFMKGQETIAQEVASQLYEEQLGFAERTGIVTAQVIDAANELASDGDPHKQRIAEILKDRTVKAFERSQQIAAGDASPEEGELAGEALPFSNGSNSSATSLQGSSREAPAIEPPQKRGPGRPRLSDEEKAKRAEAKRSK